MSSSIGDFSEMMADTVQTRSAHVVRVEGRARHASSGIIWSAEGYVLASNYTVEFEEDLVVGLPDGTRHAATLVGRDAGTDIALLHVQLPPDYELVAPQWSMQESIRLGHMILTLARPGRTLRAAMGIISTLSGRWEVVPGIEIDRFIQSDCITRAGFSGALVVDVHGMALGMLSAGLLDRDHVILPTSTLAQAISRILMREPPMLDLSEEGSQASVEFSGEASFPLGSEASEMGSERSEEQ